MPIYVNYKSMASSILYYRSAHIHNNNNSGATILPSRGAPCPPHRDSENNPYFGFTVSVPRPGWNAAPHTHRGFSVVRTPTSSGGPESIHESWRCGSEPRPWTILQALRKDAENQSAAPQMWLVHCDLTQAREM